MDWNDLAQDMDVRQDIADMVKLCV